MAQPSINARSIRAMRPLLFALAALLVAGCDSPEERAQSYYQSGMKLLAQHDDVRAGVEFKNALQLKKDLLGAWRGLAEVEEHNRNPQGLIQILRTVVELDPKDVNAKLKLGRLMLLGNALDQALDLANSSVDLDNRNAEAFVLKAAVLLRLNDGAGARREARTALDIDPNNEGAMLVLAADRLAGGDAEGALLILDKQAAVHADDLGVQLFRIKALEQLGKTDQVDNVLKKLIELYPREAAFRRALIQHYMAERRPEQAEEELRAYSTANPSDVNAGLDVVRFLQATKGPEAARQELVTRVNAGGQVFDYQIALAEFDFAQGRVADSVALLESLITKADSAEHAMAARVKLADMHVMRKELDAADQLVTEILRADSRNTNGLRIRGSIRIERGKLDDAIADIRQALNEQPQSADLMLLLASAYERSGSIELAEKQYADATKASNYNPSVTLNYVSFLRRRGSADRAEGVLTELVSRTPNNVAVLSALANVRLSRQNWAGAQEIADSIGRIEGSRPLADQILAAALSGRNQYDQSIKALEDAYTLAPAAVQPIAALVSTLVRAQQLDRAENLLKKVLDANPGNAEAHVLMGSIEVLKNAPDRAVKNFETAIEQQPKDMSGYQALASFYVREKKVDEALKIISAALKQEPDNFNMHLALASALEAKADYEGAIEAYDDILKQRADSMIVANNLASLLADHRSDKESLERANSLATMLRKSPVPQFKDTLGWIYYLRGDYRSSTPLLEEAAAELSNAPYVHYHLAMTYIATGQPTKASEQLKKALEFSGNNLDLQAKIKAAQAKVGT